MLFDYNFYSSLLLITFSHGFIYSLLLFKKAIQSKKLQQNPEMLVNALLFLTQLAFSQTQNKKSKVILLGTFHFGATTDRNSTKCEELFSEKRQAELDCIDKKFNNYAVDKIFIEDLPENQNSRNLQFIAYKNNVLTDLKILKNETVQVGFSTEKLNFSKIIYAAFEQELPHDKIEAWKK